MAKLVFHNFKWVYRRYFMVDVIEIFRTYKRKVDYSFYYNKSLLNDAKIVILNALQTVCAVLEPMDIYALCYFSECSLKLLQLLFNLA